MRVVPTAERNTKVIPDHVIADRDRRARLKHLSVGATLLGDPLPGCSALDKTPSIVPDPLAIKKDPLDYLMFKRPLGRSSGKAGGARYG